MTEEILEVDEDKLVYVRLQTYITHLFYRQRKTLKS
jgi:hypothetical protein